MKCLFVALLVVSSFLPTITVSASTSNEALIGGAKTANRGGTVDFPIKLVSDGDVGAVQLTVIYEEESLELTSIRRGADLSQAFSVFFNENNAKVLIGSISGQNIPSGEKEILIASFRVKNDAELKSHTVNFEEVALSSVNAENITERFAIHSGAISVVNQVIVIPSPSPSPVVEEINVPVESGTSGSNGEQVAQTVIKRSTDTNGIIKDEVQFSPTAAKETLERLTELGISKARIVIPDSQDVVAETKVTISKETINILNDGEIELEISTENAKIIIPSASMVDFEEELYFQLIPVKTLEEKAEIDLRIKEEPLIKQMNLENEAIILGRPMVIQTNMQSRPVSLILPLNDSLLSSRNLSSNVLENLVVFIEHSDGTKEVKRGNIVPYNDVIDGIAFEVDKFSTFTIVYLDGIKDFFNKEDQLQGYIKGYTDGTFRPNKEVSRAQMAAMLARNLGLTDEDSFVEHGSYPDVPTHYWAFKEIELVRHAGLMSGYNDGKFGGNDNISRAQMATIVHNFVRDRCEQTVDAFTFCSSLTGENQSSYSDVSSSYWAKEAIQYVRQTGIMEGYKDGTFKPNEKLTRSQAVKVLNRLFNHPLKDGNITPTFQDVQPEHWAFYEIETAVGE